MLSDYIIWRFQDPYISENLFGDAEQGYIAWGASEATEIRKCDPKEITRHAASKHSPSEWLHVGQNMQHIREQQIHFFQGLYPSTYYALVSTSVQRRSRAQLDAKFDSDRVTTAFSGIGDLCECHARCQFCNYWIQDGSVKHHKCSTEEPTRFMRRAWACDHRGEDGWFFPAASISCDSTEMHNWALLGSGLEFLEKGSHRSLHSCSFSSICYTWHKKFIFSLQIHSNSTRPGFLQLLVTLTIQIPQIILPPRPHAKEHRQRALWLRWIDLYLSEFLFSCTLFMHSYLLLRTW